ncbi:hypothetical protein NL676_014250 [Syzygium grande]|nr:hypothetical protein NL676_014250 [Syzygium grande]
MPSSQHTNGGGDECGKSSRSSQSRRPPVQSVEVFSHVKKILLDLLENLFGWQSSKDDVPNYQTAKVKDQESVERSDRRRSDDFVTGEISGISQASEARRSSQLPENNLGHEGDQRTTMVHDQEWMARSPGQRRDDVVFTIDSTDTSLREWPLLGCNHGTEDRRAAIHDRDSMQRSHGWRSHCDVVALGGTAGGSRHTEWAQLLDYLIQQGEGKKEAKTKKKER